MRLIGPDTEACYRGMGTDWLRRMRDALTIDRANTSNRESLEWIDGRIALIDRLLTERRTT